MTDYCLHRCGNCKDYDISDTIDSTYYPKEICRFHSKLVFMHDHTCEKDWRPADEEQMIKRKLRWQEMINFVGDEV